MFENESGLWQIILDNLETPLDYSGEKTVL